MAAPAAGDDWGCNEGRPSVSYLPAWKFHAKIAWTLTGNAEVGTERLQLRELLLEQCRSIERILEQVDDPGVSPVHLVELIETLEQFDERKQPLVSVLREVASEFRRREEDRSVRQFVLRALEMIGVPQPAGFLQEFVWARERVDLNTRGFGALRRDEARAWRRRPGQRAAYIVPGLDAEGHALARWMARSDWPLARRLVVHGAERLFDLTRLDCLFRVRSERYAAGNDPYVSLIRRYAPDLLQIEPPPARLDDEASWLEIVRRSIEEELPDLRIAVGEAQDMAQAQLNVLEDEEQVWGRQ